MTPSHLESQLFRALQRRRTLSSFRTLTLPVAGAVDFSSNDFLSLSSSPLLRSAFLSELTASPTFPLGSGGSRLLDGNSSYTLQLESSISTFLCGETGLLFNSGYDANAGFFACVPQPGDIVVYDELIHASVHEGMRLSRAAEKIAFPHNDTVSLEEILRNLPRPGRNVFIAVESLYSMDGDLAPLVEIVAIMRRVFKGEGAHLVVDEAHSTGVYGNYGRGLVCELGLEREVFARLHTFGKALACNGAIVICSPLVREYLINYARTLIFTTALSFPALAAIRAAFRILGSGETVELQTRLHALIKHLHEALSELPESGPLLTIQNPEQQNTPIVALLTDRPRALAKYLQEEGYMVRPIVHPTVPRGKERVRVCLHAGNTEDEIRGLVGRIKEWVESERKKGLVEKAKI
ncbi:putative aminotransferase [Trichophaea hybrida]|nr:putative aminotransferase [Trichophaea hybrida]